MSANVFWPENINKLYCYVIQFDNPSHPLQLCTCILGWVMLYFHNF